MTFCVFTEKQNNVLRSNNLILKTLQTFNVFYFDPEFWMHNAASQSVSSWRGFAFEEVCLAHFRQIKKSLDILGVSSTQSAWTVKGDDEKEDTQIDLLINRKDNVVNMCEMKFYNEKFTVN